MKLFVSDLHLDPGQPATLDQFRQCLNRYRGQLSELYILGDLFEFWIGDDYLTDLAKESAGLLRELSSAGVAVFFMAGNRDFLVGQDFAKRCGMSLLPDPTVIDLEGVPTLLSHGDHLCTDDHVYQAIRSQVRSPAWQQAVLSKTVPERLKMAEDARAESAEHTGQAPTDIMDVNADAVEQCMAQAGVTQMIHGHTHRPGTHALTVNGKPATRMVLGDWYQPDRIRVIAGTDLVHPLR